MLNKKGFNFPFRAPGGRIPPPRTLLPRGATVPVRAPTPAAASPTKSRAPRTSTKPTSPSKAGHRARGTSDSVSSDDSFASAHGDEGEITNGKSTSPSIFRACLTKFCVALASLAVSEHGHEHEDALAIQILTQFITPPPSMFAQGENMHRSPISFGVRADEFLAMRATSELELWSILRVRVHASNVDQFVHHLVLLLGPKFSPIDAKYLWKHIRFPCI